MTTSLGPIVGYSSYEYDAQVMYDKFLGTCVSRPTLPSFRRYGAVLPSLTKIPQYYISQVSLSRDHCGLYFDRVVLVHAARCLHVLFNADTRCDSLSNHKAFRLPRHRWDQKDFSHQKSQNRGRIQSTALTRHRHARRQRVRMGLHLGRKIASI